MAGLRVVRAEGDPAERGRQIGRALGETIEESLGFYKRYIERRGIASRELQDFLAPYLSAVDNHLPGYMAMIKAAVLFGMVCDVESGRMWVAPGNPCSTEFEEVDLRGII